MAMPAYTEEDGAVRLRHHASRSTGLYRGRKVIEVKQHADKKAEKPTQKQDGEEKKTVEQVAAPEQ